MMTALISELTTRGVLTSKRVSDAMESVDRGHFIGDLDGVSMYTTPDAYKDEPLPIGYRVTISAPHMHAWALQKLEPFLFPGAEVLDVGSGSGYLTVCLEEMVSPGGTVLGIDNRKELVYRSNRVIEKYYPRIFSNVKIVIGNGWNDKQFVNHRKFNAIHVGAAAPQVPTVLVDALKSPGRLVIPVGPEGGTQYMTTITKGENGVVSTEKEIPVRYVPLEK